MGQMKQSAGIEAARQTKNSMSGNVTGTYRSLISTAGGAINVTLQEDAKRESDIFTREQGPQDQKWTIETQTFKCIWPSELVLRYPAASGTWFDLMQSDNTPLYVQGPFAKEQFDINDVADGTQKVVEQGKQPCPWTELGYTVQGQQWRQRYYAVEYDAAQVILVTVQTPAQKAKEIFGAASKLAASLQPVHE